MNAAKMNGAVSAVKEMFVAKEKDFEACFKTYVEKECEIMHAIADACGTELIGPVCNKLLQCENLKEEYATPGDVFECMLRFSTAVKMVDDEAFSKCLAKSKAMTYETYYDRFIHPAVSFTWNIVAFASPTTNVRNGTCGLSKIVGSILLGVDDGTRSKRRKWGTPPISVRSYCELKEVLLEFDAFLAAGRRPGKSNAPSQGKATEFCSSARYNYMIKKFEKNEAQIKSQKGSLTKAITNEELHDGKEKSSQTKRRRISARRKPLNSRKKPPISSDDNNCKPASKRKPVHEKLPHNKVLSQLKQFESDFNETYGPTTIETLLDELGTATFHDGRMTLDKVDLVKFWNSPIVAALFHCKVNSKFYPGKDGSATTLDAICGLTHTSDPMVKKPSIKLYLQRSDTTEQNVIVLVMENYLSDAYLDEREEDVNKMKFQQHNSTQSHIRVYHDSRGLRVEDGDEVGIVFGNTKASSKLVRATGEGTVLEDDHMKMSNQIFQWEKETYEEVVGMLSEAYVERRTKRVDVAYDEESMGSSGPCKSRQNNVGKSRTFDIGTNSGCKERYEPMCGSQDIDTCVVQIGTSPYEHHADNGDDICDNDSFETSHEAMPVITHCMTFKANTSKKKGTSNKSQTIDVTIRHGVPDDTPKGTSHKMCSILGHFCGGKNIKWKKWNQKNCQGIPMGGRSHAHMQGRGAQLRLHHWITSKSSSIRVVSSGRSTRPFQNSKEKRKALLENVGRDDDPGRHDRTQILDIYTGKRRVIIPVPSPLISEGARVPPKNKRPTPSPDDGVNTKSKRRRVAQQKQFSSKTSAIDFMPTRHSNTEDVLDSEQFNRRTVVGMSNSIRKEGIFRSLVSVRQLCEAKVSANLHRNDEDDRVFVGPSLVEVCDANGSVILDNVGNPKYENMLLGQRVCSKELDASCGINNNSHNSDVVNESKMDTVNLKRLTKNSASVARNLVAILKHSEGKDQGNVSESYADWSDLEPMIIRGHGGVFTNAGVNVPRTSADTTVRESPMHILPSGQDLTGSNAQAWRKSLRVKQCMNVYFQGYYLGLYYVTRIVEEERTLEDVRAEVSRLNEHLPFLHNVDSKTFPKHIETDISDKSNSHYHEMLGMLGMTQYITLTPVEKNVSKGMQRNEWRLIDISCDEVIKPTVHINNNALKSETENPTFGTQSAGKEPLLNWSSLIEPVEGCSPLLHLSDEKRRECLNAKELKNPTLQEHGRAILGMPSHNGKGRTLEEAVNAALHASGTITAKSTSKEAVYWDEKELKLKSPRYLFGEQESQESYCEALKKTRLKSLLMTPVHSPFISTEVSAMLAVACTQSNEESLREIDGRSKKWLNRNGPEYCLNEETSNEAWQIMFTAIVCQLFTPSVFIELLEEVYEVDATTSPFHRRVDATAIIERFKQRDPKAWKSSLVHKNLRKTFENKREAFIEFLDWLALNGENAIRRAISKCDSLEREKVMTDMARIFTKESHLTFNEFSIQILTRCIECCIHEPFGEVKSVPSGYGGKEGGACFADAINAHDEKITAPEWLVLEMNARARRILVDRQPQTNDVTEDQLKLELTVMGLEWSTELDCLVHKYGIGKKLDSSDTEHLLCLINRMLQRTLPSMNTSETHQHDTDWCLPVAYWKKGTEVIDMPFMSELVKASKAILKAYRDLLDDDTYIHRALGEIYIVDMYSD